VARVSVRVWWASLHGANFKTPAKDLFKVSLRSGPNMASMIMTASREMPANISCMKHFASRPKLTGHVKTVHSMDSSDLLYTTCAMEVTVAALA
jgi:hypothetical protein